MARKYNRERAKRKADKLIEQMQRFTPSVGPNRKTRRQAKAHGVILDEVPRPQLPSLPQFEGVVRRRVFEGERAVFEKGAFEAKYGSTSATPTVPKFRLVPKDVDGESGIDEGKLDESAE